MKQILVSATFAIALAASFGGCASETADPSETGSVGVNLLVGDADVKAVSFELVCDSGFALNGQFNVNDQQDPPIWAAIMDVPVPNPETGEACSIVLIASDDAGNVLCTGEQSFVVPVQGPDDDPVKVDLVLLCGDEGDDPLGNIDIDATFEIVEGNNCPRLHFLNAVPNNVPPEGSEVTVLVSDKDGDALTTALTATGGSFVDPSAQSTTYTCDDTTGAQTISVTVSDGDTACDKSKSFPVTCPGLVCEYEQDFEGLDPTASDALANDGWLYFGSVFDGTGAFKFDFGPFPAPTTVGQISLIASGEGGPDQGANQLVVFSNYDCCDIPNQGHFNGTDRVFTAVFQQIDSIPADFIGQVFTFEFDAKRGNVEGASTAQAFIRTLDPDAGFIFTNNVELDVTDLPVDWGTYSIILELSDPALEGQVLQFGFKNFASNFEGSGNFYDNITFGPQDCAGECAVDADCPDDGNECTAAVCSAGSCETSNAADGTACNNNTGTCNAGVCQPTGPIELRPLPEIYATGKAINYSPFRAGGPGAGEIPNEADILEDLGLLNTAGYNLLRLFGADEIAGAEKILQLAAANFPEMRFQQGLFLEGLSGPAAAACDSDFNDDQVDNAIRLAKTYSNVVTVSVGNETSFFSCFMPLNCLEGYITDTRNNVSQPVTADDDYTFYTGQNAVGGDRCGSKPDTILPLLDFVSIHTYPFSTYREWDWRQLGVPAGPDRAEAMMNAALAKAQQNYQAVYNYRYLEASDTSVTIGESRPIVIGETGWKWRKTNPVQQIETYAALPVNAKWYYDLMLTWERSPGGPPTIFIFQFSDEAWKQKFLDDGWGFWDEQRNPNYVLCGTPAGSPCNDPVYEGAGFYPF